MMTPDPLRTKVSILVLRLKPSSCSVTPIVSSPDGQIGKPVGIHRPGCRLGLGGIRSNRPACPPQTMTQGVFAIASRPTSMRWLASSAIKRSADFLVVGPDDRLLGIVLLGRRPPSVPDREVGEAAT